MTHLTNLIALIPLDVPNPDPKMPPGFDNMVTFIGWAKWIALVILVILLIVAGVRVAAESNRGGGSGRHMESVGGVLVGAIIVSAAAALIGFLVG